MRPYVAGRCFKFTRSREHHGRSFSGKRNLRRTYEKSERQHGRRQVDEGLRLLEQEIAEHEADERRWAELQEDYERQESTLSELLGECGFADDPWYDDYSEQYDGERLDYYDEDKDYEDRHSCRRCEEVDAYEDLTRQERYERRERDLDGYDWDADPDFTDTQPNASANAQLVPHLGRDDHSSMAGARDGYDLTTWRGRKR